MPFDHVGAFGSRVTVDQKKSWAENWKQNLMFHLIGGGQHDISYQESVDGDDLEDAGGTEDPVVEIGWTNGHQGCQHSWW